MPQLKFKPLFGFMPQVRALAAAAVVAVVIAGSAAAQSSPSLGAPDRTEILFLGTAGGPPLRLDRSEPSTLLLVDGRPYLIDCGIGTIQRMVRAGIQSEQIKTIFFTHLHPDHDLGLADVMGNDFFKLRGSTETIDIYGPPLTKEFVDAAFRYITIPFSVFAAEPSLTRAALVNGAFTNPFVAHEIPREGLVYQDDRIRVIAAENTHYALMPPQSRQQMKSYSYRVETPHGVVVFTGDTGPNDAVTRLARGADVFVSEVHDIDETTKYVNGVAEQNHWTPQRTKEFMAHMTQEHLDLEELAEIASKAQVKSVVLYHYNPADPAAWVATVKKYFAGPVFAPADLDRYCLNAQTGKGTAAQTVVPCR